MRILQKRKVALYKVLKTEKVSFNENRKFNFLSSQKIEQRILKMLGIVNAFCGILNTIY